MQMIKLVRYVADGCGRRFASKKKCLEHEVVCKCWSNPKNRACKTCAFAYREKYNPEDGTGGDGFHCENPHNNSEHSGAPEGVDYISVGCEFWSELRARG